jgi:hypothetical protein
MTTRAPGLPGRPETEYLSENVTKNFLKVCRSLTRKDGLNLSLWLRFRQPGGLTIVHH